jgi:hypothetical protein
VPAQRALVDGRRRRNDPGEDEPSNENQESAVPREEDATGDTEKPGEPADDVAPPDRHSPLPR